MNIDDSEFDSAASRVAKPIGGGLTVAGAAQPSPPVQRGTTVANPFEETTAAKPSASPTLDDAATQTIAGQRSQLRQTLYTSLLQNPDMAARATVLGRQANVPPDVVQRNFDEVQRNVSLNEMDRLVQNSPVVASWLAEQKNANMAHDDTSALSGLEQRLRSFAGAAGDNIASLVSAPGADSAPLEFAKGLGGSFNKAAGAVNLLLGAVPTAYDKAASLMSGKSSTQMQDAWFKNFVEPHLASSSQFEANPDSPFVAKAMNTAGNLLGMISQIVLTGGGGEAVAPAAGASTSAVLGEAAAHGVKSMAFPAITDATQTAQRVYQETGDSAAAIRAAQVQYLATSAAGVVPLSTPGGLSTRLAGGFVSGAVSGEASREAMNLVLPQSMQQPFSIENALLSGLTGAGLGGILGPRPEPSFLPVVRQTYVDAAKAERAVSDSESLAQVSQLAEQSKLRERDPQGFRELIQNMTEEGNLQDLYVDHKTFTDVLNQSGVTVEQLAKTMPGVADQLAGAAATQGDIRIPVADYVTHIAGGPVDKVLLPHLKTDPDGFTYQQGQDYLAGQHEGMLAQAQQIANAAPADAEKQAQGQQVHDTILEQLNATGRFRPEVNNAYAALTRDFYTTMAERTGTTATDLYSRFPLKIGSELKGDSLEQVKRGSYNPETMTISLLKAADLSSFLHESGHFYLEALHDITRGDGAPYQIKNDFDTLLKSFGVQGDTPEARAADWAGRDLEGRREAHEQFARSFEAYLMEGKAPTLEQQTIFSRFRSWLVNIYRSIAALNVKLSPEVTGVMDRLLASDDAIKQAEQARAYFPLHDKPDGTSAEQFRSYQELGRRATEDAVGEMTARSLRDMQWLSNAKNKVIRGLQKEVGKLRDEVKDEVTKEADANPAWQAAQFIRENTGDVEHKHAAAQWKTERAAEVLRIKDQPKAERDAQLAKWDTDNPRPTRQRTPQENWEAQQAAVREKQAETVKEEFLAKPEARGLTGIKKGQYLAKNKRAIENEAERRLIEWAKDNPRPASDAPLPREFVAEMFGFTDVKAMNDAIKEAGKKSDFIEQQTDQRMLERHGEMTSADSIERAAEAAIHNESRAKFVATGLKLLADSPVSSRALAKAATEVAEKTVAGQVIRDIRPNQHAAAEAKANKEVLKLAGSDPGGAVAAQRAALLNNRLYKAAADALIEVTKGVNYLKKFDKPNVREHIELDYRDQIDALLDRFDLRKSVTNAQLNARESLLNFVERMAGQGQEPQIPEALLNEAMRQHYRDMQVEEFRGLVDAVKSIEKMGRNAKTVQDGEKAAEIATLAAEARDTMAELKQREPDSNRGLSRIDAAWIGIKASGRSLQASLLKMEQMMDWLDNRNPNGVLNRVVFRRIADAGIKEADMQAKVKSAIDELAHSHLPDVTKDGGKIYVADRLVDGLTNRPQRFTKKEMLALAGNMGNESNVSKLLNGEKWTESGVWDFLNKNMTKADWDFVAGLGRTMESLWPEKLAMSKRLGNTAPEKIAPRPFSTPHGDYEGWYWPMIYDPARSHDVAERGARAGDALFENTYARANTDTGRSNTRNENYARPLLLSIDSIPRVLRDEIHDIAYREAIIDADKFLSNGTVRKSIVSALSQEHYDQLKPWLQSIANDRKVDMQALKWFDQLAHGARTRATIVGLGYRVSTMLVHGMSAGLESIAEVGPGWMAKGLADFSNPVQWSANKDFIFARSGEMRNRMNEVDRDVREHIREIDLRMMDPASSAVQRGADLMKAHAYQGIAMLDMASALPTWMGAYHKGMAPEGQGGMGLSEHDAVYFADKTVRNAHGGTGVKDQAAIQRGPEFLKLFTMFYTFWNHNINRLMDTGRRAADPATWRDSGKASTVIMRFLIYTLGIQTLHGILHPSHDDEGNTNWLSWAGKEMAMSAFSGIPVLRDLAAHYINGKDYSATPAASMVDAIGNSGIDAANVLTGQETSDKALKHSITTAGYVFGLPTGQAASSTQFLWDVTQGKQDPQDTADWWNGMLHGDMKKR